MKKFRNIEELEQLMRDQLSGHGVEAPAEVWSQVASSTVSSGSVVSQVANYFSSLSNVLKVALFAGGIATVGVITYQANTDTPSPAPVNPIETTDIESPADIEEQDNTRVNEAPEPTVAQETTPHVTELGAHSDVDHGDGQHDVQQVTPLTDNVSQQGREETPTAGTATHTTPTIVISDIHPCQGDMIEIRTMEGFAGDWYINNQLAVTNSTQLQYECIKAGDVTVSFRDNTHAAASQSLTVGSTSASIIEEANENTYRFVLSNTSLMANWFIDDVPVAQHTRAIEYRFDHSGRFVVTAKPVNNACVNAIEHEVVIKPAGSIQFFDVFTPDGDGKNDEYLVLIENYKTFSIQIFSVRNDRVFISNDPAIGWNGRVMNTGIECPEGEYVATIRYQLEGEVIKQKYVKLSLIRE